MGSSTNNDNDTSNTKAAKTSAAAQFDETKTKAKRLWAGLTDADMQATGSVEQLADVVMRRFGGPKDVILQKLGGAPTSAAAK